MHCVRAVQRSGAGMKCGRGNRPLQRACRHDRGCAAGSRRGFVASKGRANLRSGRSVHARQTPSGVCRPHGLALTFSRKREPRANASVEHVALRQRPWIRRLAVIARASSYCRSRQAVLRLRETRPRHRTGRKPERGKRRVDGGLAKSGTPRARKRPGRTGRREDGSSELGRS